jgi:hypothetical protein
MFIDNGYHAVDRLLVKRYQKISNLAYRYFAVDCFWLAKASSFWACTCVFALYLGTTMKTFHAFVETGVCMVVLVVTVLCTFLREREVKNEEYAVPDIDLALKWIARMRNIVAPLLVLFVVATVITLMTGIQVVLVLVAVFVLFTVSALYFASCKAPPEEEKPLAGTFYR